MTSHSQYYEKSLYPLQDGVLSVVENCKTHFYLTGGTALSRVYYHHRYSDDLDFVNDTAPHFGDFISADIFSRKEPGWETFQKDIDRIAFDMLSVS